MTPMRLLRSSTQFCAQWRGNSIGAHWWLAEDERWQRDACGDDRQPATGQAYGRERGQTCRKIGLSTSEIAIDGLDSWRSATCSIPDRDRELRRIGTRLRSSTPPERATVGASKREPALVPEIAPSKSTNHSS